MRFGPGSLLLLVAALASAGAARADAPPAPPPPPPPLALQAGPLVLVPTAQVRLRAEIAGARDLTGRPTDIGIAERARLGAQLKYEDHAALFVELQDVRGFGTEVVPEGVLPADPTLNGKVNGATDLHQAYVALAAGGFELRAGRQEIALGNERLIGAVDWATTGRSFDAVRGNYDGGALGKVSLFAALVRDVPNANLLEGAALVVGAFVDLGPFAGQSIQPIAIYDTDQLLGRNRGTLGVRASGGLSGFTYDVEAYGQGTTTQGAPFSYAGLFGARGAYTFDVSVHPKIGALVDVVTGDDDPATPGGLVTFDTLYATNHKFYGYQDLFTNLPAHTKGRGLIDVAPMLGVEEGAISGQAFVHVFAAATDTGPDGPLYGVEPDLVVTWKPAKPIALQLGAALFLPIGTALGRGDVPTPFTYGQVAFTL